MLCQQIGGQYKYKDGKSSKEMCPSVDGFIMPLEEAFPQWLEIIADSKASNDIRIEFEEGRNML